MTDQKTVKKVNSKAAPVVPPTEAKIVLSTPTILLVVWLVFTTAFLLFSTLIYLKNTVIKNAAYTGANIAMEKIIDQATSCESFPVTSIDGTQVNLISVDCLDNE